MITIMFIIAVAVIVLLCCRLFFLDRELKRLSSEIRLIAETDTNAEVTLYSKNTRLKTLVIEVNTLLRNQRQRQNNLRRIDAAFKESVAGLSHDLRTPLTSVSGYLQMLQNKNTPPEKTEEYLNIIRRRLSALLALLDDLFEYTSIELNQAAQKPESLDLRDVFFNQLTLYYEEFENRHIEPVIETPEQAVIASLNRQALERILQNLIRNALVHGTGSFSASLSVEPGANQAKICISNSADLTDTDLARIFDRFYTSDRSRKGKGTGLGLAIVKQLTENMGGSINASAHNDELHVQLFFPIS